MGEIVFVTVSITLSVSVVVPVTWPQPYLFECVTVRMATCTFSVAVSMHDHVVPVFMAMSVVISEAVLVAMPVFLTPPVSMSVSKFISVIVLVSILEIWMVFALVFPMCAIAQIFFHRFLTHIADLFSLVFSTVSK